MFIKDRIYIHAQQCFSVTVRYVAHECIRASSTRVFGQKLSATQYNVNTACKQFTVRVTMFDVTKCAAKTQSGYTNLHVAKVPRHDTSHLSPSFPGVNSNNEGPSTTNSGLAQIS